MGKYIYGEHALMLRLTRNEMLRLQSGKAIVRGHKIYALCESCETVVRINKPLVGSMHVCR